jgi:hypothetical protein
MIDRFDDFFGGFHHQQIRVLWDTAQKHHNELAQYLEKYGAQV